MSLIRAMRKTVWKGVPWPASTSQGIPCARKLFIMQAYFTWQ